MPTLTPEEVEAIHLRGLDRMLMGGGDWSITQLAAALEEELHKRWTEGNQRPIDGDRATAVVAGVTLTGAPDEVAAAVAVLSASPLPSFPAELSPPLRRVLGMMMWETSPIAHALRAGGQDIARKAEDEQAVVLHWLVGFVLKHGDQWHRHAAAALHEITESIRKTGSTDGEQTTAQ